MRKLFGIAFTFTMICLIAVLPAFPAAAAELTSSPSIDMNKVCTGKGVSIPVKTNKKGGARIRGGPISTGKAGFQFDRASIGPVTQGENDQSGVVTVAVKGKVLYRTDGGVGTYDVGDQFPVPLGQPSSADPRLTPLRSLTLDGEIQSVSVKLSGFPPNTEIPAKITCSLSSQ